MTKYRIWLTRALIALAVGLPLSGLVAGLRRTPEPPPPPDEVVWIDLPRAYWQWDLSRAVMDPDWVERAGLRLEKASPDEATRLTEAMRCHGDPDRVWLNGYSQLPEDSRWFKIVDPENKDRWIGVGVHGFGYRSQAICRLAVGFDTDAEQAAPGGHE